MEHGWVLSVEATGDAGEITEDGLTALMDQLLTGRPPSAANPAGTPPRSTCTPTKATRSPTSPE